MSICGKLSRSCDRLTIRCKGGHTQQHFANECDVNEIIKKARTNGFVSHVNRRAPIYEDVSSVPDYATALGIVNNAADTFKGLPGEVRQRFDNDPGRMISFMSDPKNYDECVKIGLFKKKEVPPVVPPVVEPKPA